MPQAGRRPGPDAPGEPPRGHIPRGRAGDLAAFRLPWALVGGLAVSARTEPRFTRDLDLVIAVSDDQRAEQALHSLQRLGYHVHALVEQEAAGRLATARLVPPGEGETGVVLDVLFASSGIEPEIAEAADVLEILPGLRVPVASVGHLLALKRCPETTAHGRRTGSTWSRFSAWRHPPSLKKRGTAWP